MGTQLPPKTGITPRQFLAHVYCGQTAGWLKMLLGTEVGLGPDDILLDGRPAPPPKRALPPNFSVHLYCGQMVAHLSYWWALVKDTRVVQPMATCCQLPYVHKPAIVIVTLFSFMTRSPHSHYYVTLIVTLSTTELATPTITEHTDTYDI